jgi:hypothetical protein
MENKAIQSAGTTATEVPGSNNPFLTDVQEKIAQLRAIASAFPDPGDPQALTTKELRLATATSLRFLEKAAVFIEASPALGGALSEVATLRDAIAAELAWGGIVDEAKALLRRVETAMARKKLRAAKAARALYRVGKSFVTSDAGDAMKPHVDEMGRALKRRKLRPKAGSPKATPPGSTQ